MLVRPGATLVPVIVTNPQRLREARMRRKQAGKTPVRTRPREDEGQEKQEEAEVCMRVISSAELMQLPPGSAVVHMVDGGSPAGAVIVADGLCLRDRAQPLIPMAELEIDAKWLLIYDNTPPEFTTNDDDGVPSQPGQGTHQIGG